METYYTAKRTANLLSWAIGKNTEGVIGKSQDQIDELMNVHAALADLPDIHFETLMCKYGHDMTNKEMADFFGLSHSTVGKRAQRALKVVSAKLEGMEREAAESAHEGRVAFSNSHCQAVTTRQWEGG